MDERLFSEDASHRVDETWQRMPIGPMDLELGGHLPEVEIAYETWGTLSSSRDNAVLVCHALSGDSHAVGWWSALVGPGKAIDTDRYFVIGSNVLGGCRGSTGPGSAVSVAARPGGQSPGRGPDASRRPSARLRAETETALRIGSSFPQITVGDMVTAQEKLLAALGVGRLWLACGGSMGGMQALEWARRDSCDRAWITASAPAHSAMQIAFNEVARQAIFADPAWQGGDYEVGAGPDRGLAVARMAGHLSYLSEAAFEAKFGRRRQPEAPEVFQVESYLRYQGKKFTTRFDAGSLVALTEAIDRYECTSLAGSRTRFLVTSFSSDWLYPPHQSRALAQIAREAGCAVEDHDIDLPYGHDAFLLDDQIQAGLVHAWLCS